jgi:hypothetical protein
MLISVVLPAPFGPTMPMRSPRSMRIEKPRTIGAVAVSLGDVLRLDHQLAGKARLLNGERHIALRPVGAAVRRSARSACRSPRRFWLRFRRAVTP